MKLDGELQYDSESCFIMHKKTLTGGYFIIGVRILSYISVGQHYKDTIINAPFHNLVTYISTHSSPTYMYTNIYDVCPPDGMAK